ncbi:hypothetical protein GMMP13_120015 [Candidatus Magnetomoraceae bacterium gMMP-13]
MSNWLYTIRSNDAPVNRGLRRQDLDGFLFHQKLPQFERCPG